MVKNATAKLGSAIALVLAVLMFLFAYSGLAQMIADSGLHSTWDMEAMMLFMLVAFLIALAAAAVALVLGFKG